MAHGRQDLIEPHRKLLHWAKVASNVGAPDSFECPYKILKNETFLFRNTKETEKKAIYSWSRYNQYSISIVGKCTPSDFTPTLQYIFK